MLQIFKTSCCKLKHQKYARLLKEGGVGIRIFIFLSGKLLYFFFLACVTIRTNFLKCFAVCAVGKTFKECFHRGYPYAAIVSLLEKRHRVRVHVRKLKRKLKTKTRSSLFSLNFYANHMPFIHILNFIYARKASQIKVCKLCKIQATVEIHLYQHICEHEIQKYATSNLFT